MTQPKPNFMCMLALIDQVFATRNDPGQIEVSPEQLSKLQQIHPATLSEDADENGPLIWVLLLPTTRAVMDAFLSAAISEKELLDQTQPGQTYDCIYLCSATALPEAREQGRTKALCLKAIDAMCRQYAITSLFTWPFTKEGRLLAQGIAKACGLPLLERSLT